MNKEELDEYEIRLRLITHFTQFTNFFQSLIDNRGKFIQSVSDAAGGKRPPQDLGNCFIEFWHETDQDLTTMIEAFKGLKQDINDLFDVHKNDYEDLVKMIQSISEKKQ